MRGQAVIETERGDTVYTTATILRVLAHRGDKAAVAFLKKQLQENARRRALAARNGTVRSWFFGQLH